MDDLISRSEALELLYKIFDKYRMSTDKNTSIGKSFGTDVFKEIKEMPTAYDVDKVVEELESAENYYYHDKFDEEGDLIMVKSIEQSVAIEIVKHGSVSDDVCEWKYTKEIMDNAEFTVGCNPNALKRGIVPNNFSYHNFKYCPYCGKKIKAVE